MHKPMFKDLFIGHLACLTPGMMLNKKFPILYNTNK